MNFQNCAVRRTTWNSYSKSPKDKAAQDTTPRRQYLKNNYTIPCIIYENLTNTIYSFRPKATFFENRKKLWYNKRGIYFEFREKNFFQSHTPLFLAHTPTKLIFDFILRIVKGKSLGL